MRTINDIHGSAPFVIVAVFAKPFFLPVRLQCSGSDVDDVAIKIPDGIDDGIGKGIVFYLELPENFRRNPLVRPDFQLFRVLIVAKHDVRRENGRICRLFCVAELRKLPADGGRGELAALFDLIRRKTGVIGEPFVSLAPGTAEVILGEGQGVPADAG